VVTHWPLESDERGSRRSQSRCRRRPQDTSRANRRSVSSDHVACGSFQSLGPTPLHEVEHVERHSAAAGSSAPQAALAGAVCLALVTTARTTGRCVGGHAANDCIRLATLRARTRRLDDSFRSSRSRTPGSVEAAPVVPKRQRAASRFRVQLAATRRKALPRFRMMAAEVELRKAPCTPSPRRSMTNLPPSPSKSSRSQPR